MKTKSEKLLFIGKDGQNYLFPFILITTLFFLWGFAHAILNATFSRGVSLRPTLSWGNRLRSG